MATNETAAQSDEEKKSDSNNHIIGEEGEPINHFTEIKLTSEEAATNNIDINHNNSSADNKPSTCNNNDTKTSNNVNNNDITNKQPDISLKTSGGGHNRKGWVRHLVAVLALSSIVLANMNRQAFNQALVSMTKPIKENNQTAEANHNTTELPLISETTGGSSPPETLTTIKPFELTTAVFTTTQQPEILRNETQEMRNSVEEPIEFDDRFDWTGAQIATLQAAFSYGYTPFMIPGGRMSELYGAKWVVFISGFGSALCCILSPLFADTDYNLLVASRVAMGLCQTGVSPALYALLVRWLPPEESSVYLPMIKVGVMVGFMLGSLVSGFFTWRITFYLVGMFGIFWSAMWALTVSSDPGEHKFISKRELGYIRRELQRSNKGRTRTPEAARKAAAPWISILTNPVVLAFMLAKFTVKLSTDAQTMQIPMYLKNVFKVQKELNGILSALNFAIQAIFTGLVAWLAKEFVVRKSFGLNKTGVRRLFQGICNFGMALAYILITFNMSSLAVVCCAVILLSVAAMFGAGGEAVTPVDLSTEYSASIMAIANSSANLSGIILPSLVSFVLADQLGNSERWNLVWWIVGGIIMAGGLAYTCRVEAELQDFGGGDSTEENREKSQLGKKKESLMSIEMKSTYKKSPFDSTTTSESIAEA